MFVDVGSSRQQLKASNLTQQHDLAQMSARLPQEPPCEMQIVFTCPPPAPQWGKRCFPELGLTPSDPLLLSQGSSEPFGQLRVLLVRALSLCAAGFKPICRGKIGPLYQPSFIAHALFVNPTNYIYFPIAACFLLSF